MKKNKKYTSRNPETNSPISSSAGTTPSATPSFNWLSRLPIFILVLFMGVEWITPWDGIEYLGSQWFYLMLVNAIAITIIYFQRDNYQESIRFLLSLRLVWVYLALGLLAVISLVYAINPTETIVCLVRLLTALFTLFHLFIVFYRRTDLIPSILGVVSFFLFVQASISLLYFFMGSGQLAFSEMVLTMRLNAGNKNIYAAAMVVKVPFVLLGVFYFKNVWRIWYSLVFFLAANTIFLLNSRTTLIAIIGSVVAYLLAAFIFFLREKKTTTLVVRVLMGLALVGMAVISSRVITNYAQYAYSDSNATPEGFSSVDKRVIEIVDANQGSTQERLKLWDAAWKYTLSHPIGGCGFGNWKLASIPYSREFNDGLIVPIHAHNDFLEYFAELGWGGGILYIAIFVFLLVYGLVTFFKATDPLVSLFGFFSLVAVIAFANDSALNFPKEEPMNQLMFAVSGMSVLLAYSHFSARENAQSISNWLATIYSFVVGLILLPTIYIGFLIWRSSVAQNLYVQELNAGTITAPVDEVVNAFPSLPNLVSNTVQPIEGMLGMYLWRNKRDAEADVFLRRGAKANPYMMYVENIRANMYYEKQNWDSAAYFARLCFFERPRNQTYYQTYMACVARTYDTTGLQKGFALYNRYHPKEAFGWNHYLSNILNASQGANTRLKLMADSALNMFPEDGEIKKRHKDISDAYARR
ncbi:MAG: O-antigen ligase family protein [Sediminibacterium sp.]